jgi:alkanesulfonate monooxygenase SsuD/methylene tetrahydromethanopterin reductase-like flavin-dependent oxidoreductase (luciferase family)
VVAEHADIWNCPTRGSAQEFRDKSAALDDHCAAVGRDPSGIVRSVQILVASEHPAAGTASGSEGLPRFLGPAASRELILELIDAGARHLVLASVSPNSSVRWLARRSSNPCWPR